MSSSRHTVSNSKPTVVRSLSAWMWLERTTRRVRTLQRVTSEYPRLEDKLLSEFPDSHVIPSECRNFRNQSNPAALKREMCSHVTHCHLTGFYQPLKDGKLGGQQSESDGIRGCDRVIHSKQECD